MESTIEELWDSYLSEKIISITNEEREMIKKLADEDSQLRSRLNEEQICKLDKCKDYLGDLNYISSKRAFCQGVEFATKYLLEIIYSDLKN